MDDTLPDRLAKQLMDHGPEVVVLHTDFGWRARIHELNKTCTAETVTAVDRWARDLLAVSKTGWVNYRFMTDHFAFDDLVRDERHVRRVAELAEATASELTLLVLTQQRNGLDRLRLTSAEMGVLLGLSRQHAGRLARLLHP